MMVICPCCKSENTIIKSCGEILCTRCGLLEGRDKQEVLLQIQVKKLKGLK